MSLEMNILNVIALSVATLLGSGQATTHQDAKLVCPPTESIYETASKSVVLIKSITEKGVCSGSGVAIGEHTVATNAHVLNDSIKAAFIFNGALEEIESIVLNNELDLAVFTTKVKLTPIKIAKGMPKLGEMVYSFGCPLGIDSVLGIGLFQGMRDEQGFILFNAPISPGSSGGALLNKKGELIGITTANLTQGQNMNLAIPVENIKKLLESKAKITVVTK